MKIRTNKDTTNKRSSARREISPDEARDLIQVMKSLAELGVWPTKHRVSALLKGIPEGVGLSDLRVHRRPCGSRVDGYVKEYFGGRCVKIGHEILDKNKVGIWIWWEEKEGVET